MNELDFKKIPSGISLHNYKTKTKGIKNFDWIQRSYPVLLKKYNEPM